ncbi:MAG TPA: hypothetical protein VKP12_13590 [Kiloniellaceae bacterium]|nr:hypothetical protein [Kiloniellaceae bacterium]
MLVLFLPGPSGICAGLWLCRGHEAAQRGGPGLPRRRQAAGGDTEGRHHPLQRLRDRRIGRQRRRLVLPEIDVAARQLLKVRRLKVRLRGVAR